MPSGGTLVLSPHPDDAAFSLGGSLARGAFPGPVVVLTVFGRSNFNGHGFEDDQENITAFRRLEDQRFCDSIGATLDWADCEEAGLRIGSTLQDVFTRDERIVEQPIGLSDLIVGKFLEYKPLCIAAPMGLGRHVDHICISDAVQKSFAGRPEVVFYEELPYARKLSLADIEHRARLLVPDARPYQVGWGKDTMAQKLQCCAMYGSQWNARIESAVVEYAESLALGGAERIWTRPNSEIGSSILLLSDA